MTKEARRELWYPTQAKVRLEWGTQHLFQMWWELTGALPSNRSSHPSIRSLFQMRMGMIT
jgi:hypothetical protein